MLHHNLFHRISEFAVGLLFGLGLMLSGMTDPGKVIGFLDLAGSWDPSLALVMGGAIAVGFFAFALAKKRTSNFLARPWCPWPTANPKHWFLWSPWSSAWWALS